MILAHKILQNFDYFSASNSQLKNKLTSPILQFNFTILTVTVVLKQNFTSSWTLTFQKKIVLFASLKAL